ncbi:hypothetical protein F5H01DRAFT_27833 [Linnemannia elongata]|nr:hypothetical protein F5H01DRAFT_27833 [Linnemannia elongata]
MQTKMKTECENKAYSAPMDIVPCPLLLRLFSPSFLLFFFLLFSPLSVPLVVPLTFCFSYTFPCSLYPSLPVVICLSLSNCHSSFHSLQSVEHHPR